jgi:hypothetical protein
MLKEERERERERGAATLDVEAAVSAPRHSLLVLTSIVDHRVVGKVALQASKAVLGELDDGVGEDWVGSDGTCGLWTVNCAGSMPGGRDRWRGGSFG